MTIKFIQLIRCVAVTSVFAASICGQTRTFRWSDELCDYSGTYNARNYTPKQIRDTNKLRDHNNFSIDAMPVVFEFAEIARLDPAKLEAEYREKSAELAGLDIVPVPYWERMRRAKLDEMKHVYELSRVTIAGFSDARRLNELLWADSCKAKYAAPLITGGDSLLNAWRTVNEDSRTRNADPGRLRRIFDEQNASPDRFKFALVEVMGFGWWNCANQDIKRVDYDDSQDREFKKLFIRVKRSNCSEP